MALDLIKVQKNKKLKSSLQSFKEGYYLEKGFCKLFSESSTVVLQLPSCPGKQGELSENGLQNLFSKLQ